MVKAKSSRVPAAHTYTKAVYICTIMGQGQGDRDKGVETLVWELGTWGPETRDLGTSRLVWDPKTCGTGTQEVKYRDGGM